MDELRKAAQAALDVLDSYAKSAYIRHQHPVKFAKGIAAANDLRTALAQQQAPALYWPTDMPDEVARWITANPPKMVSMTPMAGDSSAQPQESAPRLGITLDLAQKIARDCRATRLGEPLPDSLLNLVR